MVGHQRLHGVARSCRRPARRRASVVGSTSLLTVLVLLVGVGPAVAVTSGPPDRPTVTRIPCQVASAASADGLITNITGAPVEVRFEGPTEVVVGGAVDAGADPLTVTVPEGERTLTVLGVTAGDPVRLLVGETVVEEFVVDDCRARVDVVATVDADGDGEFRASDRALAPGAPVTVRAVVTNRGVPAAISLTVTTEEGPTTVFGPDPGPVRATCLELGPAGAAGEVVTAADLVATGTTLRCTVVLPSASPGRGTSVERTVAATATPPDAAPATATASASVTTVTEVDASVAITVATDADGDGTASDAEYAPAPASDVPVRIELTNTGPAEGVPRITVVVDDGPLTVVLDPVAESAPTVACTAAGAPFLPGAPLPVDATVVCTLTLAGASPETAAARDVTATGELLAATGATGEAVVLAADRATTTVLSTIVLDETVDDDGTDDDAGGGDAPTGDGSSPDVLADGGAPSVLLALTGLALLAVGGGLAAVAGRPRRRRGRVTV